MRGQLAKCFYKFLLAYTIFRIYDKQLLKLLPLNSIRVRGTTSIMGGNDPLVIIEATDTAIRKMIKETDGDHFEDMRSLDQELTFCETKKEFQKRNIIVSSIGKKHGYPPETHSPKRNWLFRGASLLSYRHAGISYNLP